MSGQGKARIVALPALWFTFRMPVARLDYALSGLLLVPVKFGLDSLVYRWGTGESWSWTGYLHPSYSLRFDRIPADAYWVIWALALLTVPFLWIGMSMTVRRCMDAHISPAFSLLFFVPAANYLFMIALCLMPSRPSLPEVDPYTARRAVPDATVRELFLSLASGAALGLAMLVLSVLLLDTYGMGLFVGAPFVMGAVSAFLFNRPYRPRFVSTFGVTQLALLVASLAILMFALEGVICLIMAYPIAMLLALLGGLLGRAVARLGRAGARAMTGIVVALPLLLPVDVAVREPPLREVRTAIDIDAPPRDVWASVTSFPELPPPKRWIFHLGVACPTGARIEGQGVGAIRYCDFTTGSFVEPITAWEPPSRLAFDVVAQPLPLHELSPYGQVWAPHLQDGLVSRRGEFRIVELPAGRSRLEGRTWYTLDLFPQWYWALWSDFVIQRIHLRVLEHVRDLSEGRHGP